MTLYAIGDVQGCYSCLQQLLDKIEFKRNQDQLWFVGDLVNRGPDSLGVLRFVKSLGSSAVTVLGNHDLHLIATAYGFKKLKSRDTIQTILDAPDCSELIDWLRYQPLFHVKQSYCLVHAGIAPQWTIHQAGRYAQEVETTLRSDQIAEFLKNMYGDKPDRWNESLSGWERLRFITNVFTRIRYCTIDGALQMKAKHSPADNDDENIIPWFEVNNRQSATATIIFGHWSTLGLQHYPHALSLDTGCVWGRRLTAIRLNSEQKVFQVHCGQSA
ncbi:MAG TPA: symmetrical bis(5'-nucleosyl)-tetraphosphatase [Crenotrichaceae bacterium]|nr:symmetrical bis(5'-nucleosyl)-tetraphosphatase [Crenotrichaceae bacterium]